jgi:LuxR family maltose regulon positive regulatory protein
MVAPRKPRMIAPEPPSGIIDRPRLALLVDERPVTVLAGMAGYGKSTVLAAAARRHREHGAAAWLTLDDTDKDPVRLVGDLVAAAGLAGVGALTNPVEQIRASSLRAEPLALLDTLLESLYDSASPILLALDDVQHLAGSSASTEIIDHLLRWAPTNLRISISARVLPPLRLQRLRLEDRLTYLAHDELAFSPDESVAAVRATGLDLDRRAVDSIHTATGGWPAGVRMAVLAARHSPTPTDLLLELRRDQALADYLATEVLASLPTDLRDFVLESSLDERVCPSLIDTIRGTTNAEVMLDQCLAAGLFLSREELAADEQWYSWHSLFAAHTQRRLTADHPDVAARLHGSAAAWWRPIDAPSAIRHALTAGDWETAARIFSESWLELYLEGRVDAVLALVDRLPTVSTFYGDAHLARALSFVQRGRLSEARAEVDAAVASSSVLPEGDRSSFKERTAIVELFLTGYLEGLGAAVEPGIALLEQLDEGDHSPDPAVRASVEVFVGMGEARLQQHLDVPLVMLRSSATTAHDTGLLALELTALAESCIPAIAEGRLTEVHDLAVDVLARAEERGWVGLSTLAPAVAYLGWLDYWRGNLREARAELERSLSMLLPFDWELRGLTLNFHVKTCVSLGDLRAARSSADEISALISAGPTPAWWPSMLAGVEGLILAAEGHTVRAVALALTPTDGPQYRLAAAHRAKVLLRAGRPAEALSQLRRAPASGSFVHVECLSRCLEAEALAVLGKQEAHLALEKALAAAEPDGLYGPFLSAGDDLAELLKAHLRHGTSHPAAVTQVLGRLADGHEHRSTAWGEQLTDRERVILRYLATNLTNTEIADAEFISLHTAKTHIAHIYRKLGVSNRRAAIHRAAELDLY